MNISMTQKTNKRRSGFYFDLEGQPENYGYPSVTTVLKVVGKPELDYWKAKTVAEETLRTLSVEQGILAPKKVMENAGDEGTIAHELIDKYWSGTKYDKSEQKEKVQQYLTAFEEFVKIHNPKMIESEGICYSHKYEYAGTYDGIFEIAGEKWLIDWKTSNGIYRDHKVQIVAYRHALKEMGVEVDKMVIVQLKNNGLPNVYMVGEKETENEIDMFKAFRACLHLWKTWELIK
jgi:hypothetical protein